MELEGVFYGGESQVFLDEVEDNNETGEETNPDATPPSLALPSLALISGNARRAYSQSRLRPPRRPTDPAGSRQGA